MKRILLIALGVFLIFGIIGCRSNKLSQIFGKYKFEEVSYLSPLSSSTIDFLNQNMRGTEYTISVDNFEIKPSDDSVKIESPAYVKEEVPTDSDAYSFIHGGSKYQYTIYDKEKKKTYLRIYSSSDSLWIARYVDNTANGEEIIMSIYKLRNLGE